LLQFSCKFASVSVWNKLSKYNKLLQRNKKGAIFLALQCISQNVTDEAVTCMREGERTSLRTSAKVKPALFRATNGLPRKMRYVSRHFCRSYLKANKISRCNETRKVEDAYNFWMCTGAIYSKLWKSVHAFRNYSLPTLARFLRQCSFTQGSRSVQLRGAIRGADNDNSRFLN